MNENAEHLTLLFFENSWYSKDNFLRACAKYVPLLLGLLVQNLFGSSSLVMGIAAHSEKEKDRFLYR